MEPRVWRKTKAFEIGVRFAPWITGINPVMTGWSDLSSFQKLI